MRYLTLLCTFIVLLGCNGDSKANNTQHKELVWVYAQFNVAEQSGGIDSFYYYGKVSKSLYSEIVNNTKEKGFVHLQNIKYWGNDDLIHALKDNENVGDMAFRIEDIVRIKQVNNEPIAGQGVEQFDEPAADTKADEQAVVKAYQPASDDTSN